MNKNDDEQMDLAERFMLQQELEEMAVAYLNQDLEEQEEEEERKKKEAAALNGSSQVTIKDEEMKGRSSKEDEDSKAKGRWKLLSCRILQIPLNDKATDAFKFPSFDLFDVTTLPDHDPSENKPGQMERNWCSIRVKSVPGLLFKVCTVKPVFSHKELHGYNNTGNTQIWASEECTSIFCLENLEMFRGKTVVELGAGMTALAGLVVAAECHPAKVILTDGNEKSVENIKVILKNNPFYCENVSAQVLRWDDQVGDLEGVADIVICSDCLFFDEGRAPLVQCLKKLLKTDGQVIMIQPSRRGTMEKFIHLVQEDGYFQHELTEKVSDQIEEILESKIVTEKMYEADIHRSMLLKLRVKSTTS